MITTNEFCKREYGEKLYKISFDAGFTCPNRDGKVGDRGCIFCSQGGSGDFAVRITEEGFEDAIVAAKEKVAGKFKGNKYIAYFQAFTGTYAEADTLRKIYLPIVKRDDIAVLSIATRPDCLSKEVLTVLDELNRIKPLWVELGLQTTKEESIEYIRRGYKTEVYDRAVQRLNSMGIHTITHVILYLPGESREDMLTTVRHCAAVGTKGIKLQLLHILKGTDLAKEYEIECENESDRPGRIYIPTLREYCDTVRACVEACPEDMVFHRLTGDPPKNLLIEPRWSADKKRVRLELAKALAEQ